MQNLSINSEKTTYPRVECKAETLYIIGSVYYESVTHLAKLASSALEQMKAVKIDLSGLEHCDSSLLALCVEWLRKARGANKEIIFINLPIYMQDLVKVHGLESILPVLPPESSCH